MVQAIVYVVAITAFVIFCVWLAWADSAVHDAEANGAAEPGPRQPKENPWVTLAIFRYFL
jgi:putative Ca2+/H+ antiporter (TMEM165/GDT1 family)